MSQLPHNLYTAAQVRRLDQLAISRHNIPGITLMERAGVVSFSVLRKRWPAVQRIAVLCGTGNNGGDGFVLARLAREAGIKVDVLQLGDPARISGEAALARDSLRGTDVEYRLFEGQSLRDYELLVDALLGTGLSGDVGEPWATAIAHINDSGRPVLALDIPSGVHADSGHILGCAVRAAVTVSFIGLKQGMFTGDGVACCGRVVFSGLQVPTAIYQEVPPSSQRISRDLLEEHLPPRPLDTHKGHCGHVLVIGGAPGMSGAARMAAEAAARAGTGLVSVATHPAHAAVLNQGRPELMVHAVDSARQLPPLVQKATVIALGPGLGQDPWAQDLYQAAMHCGKPLVVDADALNLLAREEVSKRDDWVLTPHPGEAARLLERSSRAVQDDRFAAVLELQQRYGGVAVLKGAGTLVASDSLAISLCSHGNPGMASGGMGDVLTGLIAGLMAQGLSAAVAAQLGVYVHARAGDEGARLGERGLLAADLLPFIHRLVNPLRR